MKKNIVNIMSVCLLASASNIATQLPANAVVKNASTAVVSSESVSLAKRKWEAAKKDTQSKLNKYNALKKASVSLSSKARAAEKKAAVATKKAKTKKQRAEASSLRVKAKKLRGSAIVAEKSAVSSYRSYTSSLKSEKAAKIYYDKVYKSASVPQSVVDKDKVGQKIKPTIKYLGTKCTDDGQFRKFIEQYQVSGGVYNVWHRKDTTTRSTNIPHNGDSWVHEEVFSMNKKYAKTDHLAFGGLYIAPYGVSVADENKDNYYDDQSEYFYHIKPKYDASCG